MGRPAATLRAELGRFRAEHGLSQKLAAASPRARELMDRHDVLHVLFGLDTSLRQEAMVDLWTVFGSTARWADMVEYLRLPEEQEILREIGFWRVVATALAAAPDAVRIACAARRLKRKWPWDGHRALLDRPVTELRAEFGVAVGPQISCG